MFTHVAINSLAISKNKESNSEPLKYNIEVSIEEIENKEDKNKLKYVIVLLSEPKNVRLAVEGTVDISGDQSERTKILEKDENNVPRLLHLIYEELFPVFFMSTKTIGVPCPAYRLSQISEPSEIDESPITEEQEIVSTAPEQPATPEQPTATPEVEATPEQPTATPEVESTPASVEKKPEEMALEELNQLYSKLGTEYQNNPSGEVGEKLQHVSNLIQKRQQEQMATESSM